MEKEEIVQVKIEKLSDDEDEEETGEISVEFGISVNNNDQEEESPVKCELNLEVTAEDDDDDDANYCDDEEDVDVSFTHCQQTDILPSAASTSSILNKVHSIFSSGSANNDDGDNIKKRGRGRPRKFFPEMFRLPVPSQQEGDVSSTSASASTSILNQVHSILSSNGLDNNGDDKNKKKRGRPKKIRQQMFKCNICGIQFTTEKRLIGHEPRCKLDKPYPCPVCFKSFTCAETLKNHLPLHNATKPFECSLMVMDKPLSAKERKRASRSRQTEVQKLLALEKSKESMRKLRLERKGDLKFKKKQAEESKLRMRKMRAKRQADKLSC